MSSAAASTLPPDVDRQLEGLAPAELAVSVPTYNNIATVSLVLEAIRAGFEKHFADVSAVLINADAGSSDATVDRFADAGLPLVRATHEAPPAQLATVPFHGVPGRGAALRLSIDVARRLGAAKFKNRRKHSQRLADVLGEDHDLAVLNARMAAFADRGVGHRFALRIDKRRSDLQREAHDLGKRLYGTGLPRI